MYSKFCKSQRRKYKAYLIDKLDNLFDSDPKAYWLLDDLKENKRDSVDSMPSADDMFDYFSTLNKLPSKFEETTKEIEKKLGKI